MIAWNYRSKTTKWSVPFYTPHKKLKWLYKKELNEKRNFRYDFKWVNWINSFFDWFEYRY